MGVLYPTNVWGNAGTGTHPKTRGWGGRASVWLPQVRLRGCVLINPVSQEISGEKPCQNPAPRVRGLVGLGVLGVVV